MGDDSTEPEDQVGESMPPKVNTEDNPWYLLATLYGVPLNLQDKTQGRNRCAWNRYFAENLDGEKRVRLIEEKLHPQEELTPFSETELRAFKNAFAERSKGSKGHIELPASDSRVDFSNVKFDRKIDLSHYIFIECLFTGAEFSERVDFREAHFIEGANFETTIFFGDACFSRATFFGSALFRYANFSAPAYFSSTIFFRGAFFDDATFYPLADFIKATFWAWTHFRRATFSGGANFSGTTFFRTDFFGAAFKGPSEFVNAEMKGETTFEGATFNTEPPRFFGAKLHQGTVWRGITWPPTPKGKDEAGAFVDAYACLKLEMDRLKKHEDELKFFSLELRSLRILRESKFRGSGIPIALYGIICDYGRSYIRPLIGLFVVAAIGALIFLPFKIISPWQSLGLSFANTFNVFGFRKDYFDAAAVSKLPDLLKILSAVQTILGTILLFLVGLGIRNRFRMK